MRDNKIDFFKGLLMFSVVFGHTINALLYKTGGHIGLHILLRTFDMPMFMLISGYLLRSSLQRHGEWCTIANRTTGIALPSIIWMIITFAIGNTNTYYFLWAVFGSTVIIATAHKIFKSEIFRIGIVAMCILLLHTTDFKCMNMAYLMPFFVIGYYTKSLQIRTNQGIVAILLFIVAFCFWKTDYTIWNAGANVINNTPQMLAIVCFRLTIGILGIIAALFIFNHLYDRFGNKWLFLTTAKFGKETLALYLTQYVAIEVGLAKLMHTITANNNGNPLTDFQIITGYVIAPIVAFVILMALYLFVSILKKYKATRWLFGIKVY